MAGEAEESLGVGLAAGSLLVVVGAGGRAAVLHPPRRPPGQLLASEELRSGEVSPAATEQAKQLIAELAANAALHGRERGRDFRLALTLDTAAGTLRIAVTASRRRTSPTRPRHSSSSSTGLWA